jgi:hypothetical protein
LGDIFAVVRRAISSPLARHRLVPWLAPKFAPAIVTDPPTAAAAGVRLVMLGGTVTVKVDPLLNALPTVTTTLPVAAPAGTGATMPVALQLVGVAAVPLKVTVLVPWLAPKFAPAIVTDPPTAAAAGVRLVMLGAGGPPPEVTGIARNATMAHDWFPAL